MIKAVKKGFIMTAMLLLIGCSGGSKKGMEVPDTTFANLHETTLSGIELQGDFSLTYNCKVENSFGTLENSELEFDLKYDGRCLTERLLCLMRMVPCMNLQKKIRPREEKNQALYTAPIRFRATEWN